MQGTRETNQEVLDRIHRAVELRTRMDLPGADCLRLVDGEGDRLPGLFIDEFAGHWLVSTMSEEQWPTQLESTAGSLGWKSLFWRRLDNDDRQAPQWRAGHGPEAPFPCSEHGLKYRIDFGAGYSPGIFLDQRNNRFEVRRRAGEGRRILNSYAYTCAFSIAAAAGGATVTSLDLSPRYLEWGKANFVLNEMEVGDHFFCKGDTLDWMRQFGRKGRTFHGIVLDPPTFSRGPRGKVWRVEKDFSQLVEAAASIAEPGGWLLCCTNCRKLPAYEFEHAIFAGLGDAGRKGSLHSSPMPEDFRGEAYLQSIWVELA